MLRIFELNRGEDIERKIVTDNEILTQYIINETTAEYEKRMGMKVCHNILSKCNGEIKGYVWEEDKVNIESLGWASAKEFIKARMFHYKECSVDM